MSPKVLIGNIARVGAGQGAPQDPSVFGNDGHPFIRAGSLDLLSMGGGFDTLERISQTNAAKYGMKLYPENTIVFAKSGMSAMHNRVYILPQPAYVVSHLATLHVDQQVNPHYLRYFWEHYQPSRLVQDLAYPSISLEAIAAVQLDLPLPREQKRIATILDKVDRLRRLRRYALEVSDSYLRSVFVEMFGDPATNARGWEVSELRDVCTEIYRYPTFYGFTYQPTGTPVARIGNITSTGFLNPDLSEYVRIDPEISNKYPRTILEMDDIVMAVRGDGSTVSRIGRVNSKNLVGANISPNLLRFKANADVVDPLYLFHLLISNRGQELLERHISRTAKKTITAEDIKAIRIPVPCPKSQETFARIVRKFERLRSQQSEATRQAEHLFQTLLHKAFRGELSDREDVASELEGEVHNRD